MSTGHKFKSVARRLQDKHPDLSYSTALRFCVQSELAAQELVKIQPEIRFFDALLTCADKLVR